MASILPKAVRDLAQELARLPGIGPKTAQRLSIHLLKQPSVVVQRLAQTLVELHQKVYTCSICFNLAESEVCNICKDTNRSIHTLCVVEDPLDIEAIERTGFYHGRYHVLGGVLSPLEGIGADELTITELIQRLQQDEIQEVILALEHSMEGEATARHIVARLPNKAITVTRLARGLPTGGDIEFADAMTLSAAFEGRKRLENGK